MIVIRMLLLAAFLFLAPVILGAAWTALLPAKNRCRLWACFPIGVFVEIAIFQLLEVPAAFLQLPFTMLCRVFAGVMAVSCAGSALLLRRKKPIALGRPALDGWQGFYLCVFLALLGYQLYNGFTRDTTVWSYDDAGYIGYAADTLRYNAIQTIDPYTGLAVAFNAHRALQGWLYFPAFLSLVSGLPVTVMERTVLATYDILLAYAAFAYMASVLFPGRENRLIFLILLSVLHIFGLYSQYSVTFRLLGPNYQGKAIVAASLFPLLFTYLVQILDRAYSRGRGLLLMLFSVAATSLTMFGAATMIANTTLVVALSILRRRRRWKHLGYILWGVAMPVLYCGIYFLNKNG